MGVALDPLEPELAATAPAAPAEGLQLGYSGPWWPQLPWAWAVGPLAPLGALSGAVVASSARSWS